MEKANIQEILKDRGEFVTISHGISMFPMLRNGKDTVVIRKPYTKLKKYDVPLYIRKADGAYILHRIVGIKNNEYIIRGDNLTDKEYGIEDSDIIGVLSEFYRGKLHIKCDSTLFKVYSRFAVAVHPLQMLLKSVKKKIKAVIH